MPKHWNLRRGESRYQALRAATGVQRDHNLVRRSSRSCPAAAGTVCSVRVECASAPVDVTEVAHRSAGRRAAAHYEAHPARPPRRARGAGVPGDQLARCCSDLVAAAGAAAGAADGAAAEEVDGAASEDGSGAILLLPFSICAELWAGGRLNASQEQNSSNYFSL